MPKKAQMNANYRRNEKLLEDGEIDIPGSGGGVSQQYVDDADASTLAEAKEYTDDEIAGIEIPEYTAGTGIAIDNGVISNTAPNQVPAIATGDAGKVLQVNAGETGVEWASSSGSLPITIRSGTTNPRETTVGAVGDLYINTNSGQVFICRVANIQTNRYSWSYLVLASSSSSIEIAGYSGGVIRESYNIKWATSESDMYGGGIFTGYIKNGTTGVNKTYSGTFIITVSSGFSINHIYAISGCEITISSNNITGVTQISPFTDIFDSEGSFEFSYYGTYISPDVII